MKWLSTWAGSAASAGLALFATLMQLALLVQIFANISFHALT
jgi:hypothetical protein